MEIVLIFTLISIVFGIILAIQSGTQLSEKSSYSWVLPLVLSAILIITSFTNIVIVNNEINRPNVEDVIKGKAVYQENYHIVNNDTTKTYTIIWKK